MSARRCKSKLPATTVEALGRADGTTVIGLESAWTWLAMAAFWASNVILAIAGGAVARPVPYAVSVLLMALLFVVLNAARGDRLPGWATTLVIVLPPLMTVLGITAVDYAQPGMAYYFITQGTSVIFGFACLRGRIPAALIGFVLCTAVTVLANAREWIAPDQLMRGYVNALAVMAIGVLFTVTVGRAARGIYQLRVRTLAEVSQRAAQTAILAERDVQLRRLDATARPILKLIASGAALAESEALRATLIEGQLRDQMRAPGLDTPRLADAVAWARARGVRVTLLDDSVARESPTETPPDDPAWNQVIERVATVAIAELAAAPEGTSITVRLLPRNRESIATMLVSDGVHVTHREFKAPQ
ncbi:hypothetical protein HH308_02585 [Gordonia sp. TBRC 11910]|uniref:Signal transduction histidine kinase n=1 Tax=Gordonia asplenii TaxID=2725283 RepID=A0A848KXB0_9ACTN|nr:hypothetical protein [Gordonia asplenii]NMO00098.1 hypothetical protein [Gordonia asplenii]